MSDNSSQSTFQVSAMAIKVVFFDIGETLVDETRQWGGWAD